MRAQGNGTPSVCANNLLRMVRGEVPYERVKGLDPRLIDKPFSTVRQEIDEDADFVVGTYEPRVQLLGIEVQDGGAAVGGLSIIATVAEREG